MKVIISNKKTIFFIYLIVILFAYSPVFLSSYGFSDDFSTLFSANFAHTNFIKWDVMSGRPLYAALRYYTENKITNLYELKYLRIISISSIVMMAFFLYIFFKKTEMFDSKLAIISTPLFIIFLPSVMLYGAWATCFPYVTSIILSGISFWNLNYNEKQLAISKFLISLFILSLSFSIYQPTGMSYSFFILCGICLNNSAFIYRKVIINFCMLLSGMIISFIYSKLFPLLIYGESFQRSKLTSSITEKIFWFFNNPFHDTISNYNIFYSKGYFLISLFLFLFSLCKIYSLNDGFKKLILSIILISVSFSPNLIIAETWVSYRSLISLSLAINIIILFGIMPLLIKMRSIPLTVSLILISYNCYSFINCNFSLQYKKETELLSNAIINKVNKNYDGYLMFDLNNPQWNVFSRTKYDEIGAPSIQIPWAIAGIAQTIKNDLDFKFKIKTNSPPVISPSNKCINNCIVIPVTKYLEAYKNKK